MKQLTRIQSVDLYKVSKQTTPDGDSQETETSQGSYKVVIQELDDQVSATVYGANINKVLRISSIHRILEILLKEKLNNSSDNISKYRIKIGTTNYKIVNVKSKYVDIERV